MNNEKKQNIFDKIEFFLISNINYKQPTSNIKSCDTIYI